MDGNGLSWCLGGLGRRGTKLVGTKMLVHNSLAWSHSFRLRIGNMLTINPKTYEEMKTPPLVQRHAIQQNISRISVSDYE